MGSGVFSGLLVIFNIVYTILGLAIAATAMWLFIEIYGVTSLRNSNHYKLDYSVYWPQALPWLFIFTGIFVLIISCCGFIGARRQNRSMVRTYMVFQGIALALLLLSAILSIIFADSVASDSFIKDAIWDAFLNMRGERDLETAFGLIERKMQCCGATSPRDYKGWRDTFPMSCCDTYYHGWSIEPVYYCSTTDKMPNERLGCAEVATYYVRMAFKILAGAAIFTAIIGICNIISAYLLSKSLRNKNKKPQHAVIQHESQKVLL